MSRTRSFALCLLALCTPGLAACTPNAAETTPPRADDAALPLVLRDLGLASGSNWPHELLFLQGEVRANISRDLFADGPFRRAKAGEQPYVLDLWIPAMTRFSGVDIVFQLHAPSGALVLEERLIGHYGFRHNNNDVVAEAVRTFKQRAELRQDQLRGDVALDPVYVPRPAMIAMARHRPGPIDPPPPPNIPNDLPATRSTVQHASRGSTTDALGAATRTREPSPPPLVRRAVTPTRVAAVPSTPPRQALVSAAPQPATFVLTIGIDGYRDAPPAVGAEADATRVDALFADTFNVPARQRRLLLGERATRSDIDEGLRWLAESSRRGGRVVVYFSGHGTPDPGTGAPQIVPYEADPADVSRVSLGLAELERRLAGMPARDRLLIVDAGFTGQGPRSLAARGVRPLTLVDPPTAIIRLVAASPGESAGAAANLGGGLFTHYLLAALGHARADGDGDGQITLAELQSWLTPRVQSAARTRGAAQTPAFTLDPRGPARDDVVLGWGYPVL